MSISKKLENLKEWEFPKDWQRITTIDMHTAGEPLRIILAGYPELEGDTILKKRRWAKQNCDHLRTALMWEPRGHSDMYGCIVTPPVTGEADFGVLFLHNEGYSTMCGHAIIAITRLAVDLGLVEKSKPVTRVKIDSPAGLITSNAEIDEFGQVTNIYFHNVPSFVLALDIPIDIPETGRIKYDLAYGGAFYAYVQAKDAGLKCTPEFYSSLIKKGMLIKNAVKATGMVKHPFEKDLSFLYGTIFIDKPLEGGDSRNVCVFAEGEVDRSPTGTGVSGRMAIFNERKQIGLNEPVTFESILGTKFTGSIAKKVMFGPHSAIIPRVDGTAFITGRNEFVIDPNDPLKTGFIFR